MTRCTACGADNKAVAKFCRQCGASLAEAAAPVAEDDERTVMMSPTPPRGAEPVRSATPSATAGADMTPVFPPSATGRVPSVESSIPPSPVKPTSAPAAPRLPPHGTAGPQPAQTSQIPRMIVLGVVALAVLGTGAYFAWNLMRPARQEPASPPPVAAAPVVAAPPAAVPESAPPAAAVEPTRPVAEEPAAPASASAQVPADAAQPPQEPTPQAAPAPETGPEAKPKETPKPKPTRAEKQRKKVAAETKPPAPSAPVAPEPAAAPQPAPAPQPDPLAARFGRMQDELRACGTFNLFCQERVRWKYCTGYWGKVPQCPGASRPGEGG